MVNTTRRLLLITLVITYICDGSSQSLPPLISGKEGTGRHRNNKNNNNGNNTIRVLPFCRPNDIRFSVVDIIIL